MLLRVLLSPSPTTVAIVTRSRTPMLSWRSLRGAGRYHGMGHPLGLPTHIYSSLGLGIEIVKAGNETKPQTRPTA
eukprot:1224105-Pyramimonas_sp.AAC.1